MTSKRVHILSVVNAGNVSKDGSTYTIRDVVGAVDDIVMNSRLYPADQLKAAAATLEGKPAPAGHPKNSAGQAISALNGEALASAWIGSYVLLRAWHCGRRSQSRHWQAPGLAPTSAMPGTKQDAPSLTWWSTKPRPERTRTAQS